jgi:Phosphotransferase enzyme family
LIQNRSLVLWLGQEANQSTKSSFEILELPIRYLKNERSLNHNDFASSCALIISVPTNKAGVFHTRVESLIIPALNHGLIVLVECTENDFVDINKRIITSKLEQTRVVGIIRDTKNPNELPRRVFKHLANVGLPYIETCEIKKPNTLKLDDYQEVFLKRAFSDCTEIYIAPLKPGLSASIYCIHATIQNEQPMPFFAKFDSLNKILKEQENYKYHVLPSVPFNLRPNIDANRCILGATNGLLVGNFVENAASLWDCIIAGNSKPTINSLFEDSLRAWRHPINPIRAKSNLFIDIFREPDPEELLLLNKRWRSAKKHCPNVTSPKNLIELITTFEVEFVKTRVHGDLHTENVQVRNNEAILIDFTKVHWGPSSIDSTLLEVWIAFYKWPAKSFEVWKATVDELYSLSNNYIELPKVKHHPEEYASVWNAIRQIRVLAFPLLLDNSHAEYQACLAFWMYKFATYKLSDDQKLSKKDRGLEEQKRGYAYYLAYKLITSIKNNS